MLEGTEVQLLKFERRISRFICCNYKILDYKNGHSIKPNRVALKYHDFKKDVDLDVHVRVFNYVMKAYVKTSKEYIINVFNYMLKNTTSN